MLNSKTRQIGEVEYTIAPFTGMEAIKLPSVLAKYFGPVLTRAFMSALASGSILDADIGGIFSTLPGFFENLEEATYWQLIKRLLDGVMAVCPDDNGQKMVVHFNDGDDKNNYTKVFQGRVMDVFKVIGLVLEVNYPDFFALTQQTFGDLLKKKTDMSAGQSPEASKS